MKKTNVNLESLVHELKKASSKENVGIWKAVAIDLEKPTRQSRVVNLSRINRAVNDNETIVIPGKVLAGGELQRKVTIAAFKFSKQAIDKITKTGKAISIMELLRQNPKGQNVRIIG